MQMAIKTYVELGMGVGIVNAIAYSDRDRDYIRCLLIGLALTTWIAIRKEHLRGFGYDFISLCSPDTDIQLLKKAAQPTY